MIFNFKSGFDNGAEGVAFKTRPLIAISAHIMNESSALHFAYSQAIISAGGVPFIVPANSDGSSLTSLMRGVDGVVFSGGDDIDARYFGEDNIPNLTDLNWQRDYSEFMMLRAALDCGLPILAICRGCQLVNIALGGSIYQDLPSMYPQKPLTHSVLTNKHLPVHDIDIVEGSLLHKIIGNSKIGVNSRHHQAIKDLAPSLKVCATSEDGVVEAVEAFESHKIIALQCHPENLATDGGSLPMQNLFKFIVEKADIYRRAKQLHLLNPVIDSHCDTPMLYERGGFNFECRNSAAQVDVVKMNEGYLDTTITVAYISQKTPPLQATSKAFNTLKLFREDITKLSDSVVVVDGVEKLLEAKRRGLKSIILALENGYAIGDDLANIEKFKDEGIAYITLCHNGTNAICDSAIGDVLYGGVSDFGKEVISKMNKLGILVDVSHSSELSTLDAIKLSSQPVIASHSSCKALFNHPRNLTDEAIELIAGKGGVVQVCGYGGFLKEDDSATIHDVVAHIEHIISLVGYDYVGVGSDFDGGGGVVGFNGANEFINISFELLSRGHKEENVAKIIGGNILRVLKSVNYGS